MNLRPRKPTSLPKAKVAAQQKPKCKLAAALLDDSTTEEETALNPSEVQQMLGILKSYQTELPWPGVRGCRSFLSNQ